MQHGHDTMRGCHVQCIQVTLCCICMNSLVSWSTFLSMRSIVGGACSASNEGLAHFINIHCSNHQSYSVAEFNYYNDHKILYPQYQCYARLANKQTNRLLQRPMCPRKLSIPQDLSLSVCERELEVEQKEPAAWCSLSNDRYSCLCSALLITTSYKWLLILFMTGNNNVWTMNINKVC